MQLDRPLVARKELDRARALFREAGDVQWEMHSLLSLSNVCDQLCDYRAAVAHAERALEVAEVCTHNHCCKKDQWGWPKDQVCFEKYNWCQGTFPEFVVERPQGWVPMHTDPG